MDFLTHSKQFCDPEEVALKSFFLGPQAENADWVLSQVHQIFCDWFKARRDFSPQDGNAISQADKELSEYIAQRHALHEELRSIDQLFRKEIPKFSPRYIGHMFSEISLPALFGHLVALLYNPNNISKESSWVGVEIEKKAISYLAAAIGYNPLQAIGHFTSGGTVANFEAILRAKARTSLWGSTLFYKQNSFTPKQYFEYCHQGWTSYQTQFNISEESNNPHQNQSENKEYQFHKGSPWRFSDNYLKRTGQNFNGPVMLVPAHKHYSWLKGNQLFGIGADNLWPIALNSEGKTSIEHLKSLLFRAIQNHQPISMVVSVLGTTELGQIDAIHEIQDLLTTLQKNEGLHIWHHIDAAYGGFWLTTKNSTSSSDSVWSPETLKALQSTEKSNSLTIDPHKLGYVPYASGAFLCSQSKDYFVHSFSAPYVQFDPSQDLGPYTLEGSRSAAGALATYLTHKSLSLDHQGLGRLIKRTIRSAHEIRKSLSHIENLFIAPSTEANVVAFHYQKDPSSVEKSNEFNHKIFENFSKPSSRYYVSKTDLFAENYGAYLKVWNEQLKYSSPPRQLTLIRLVVMNPFFSSKEMSTHFLEDFIKELVSFIHSSKNLKE